MSIRQSTCEDLTLEVDHGDMGSLQSGGKAAVEESEQVVIESDVECKLHNLIDKFPESTKTKPTCQSNERDVVLPRKPENMIHEVPVFVPKVTVHEVVKEVPQVEVDWVERIVEVPKIQYVDKYEEVPQVQYVLKHVPRIETVEVPREVIRHVPRIEYKTVEKIVHVPSGEKIPIPRVYGVTTECVVPRFFDRKVPVIMSQQIIPEVTETNKVLTVDSVRYLPQLVPVDVYVPKPVNVTAVEKGIIAQREIPVANPDPQLLQELTIELNPHLIQLEQYNASQREVFQGLIEQSREQAMAHNLIPPPPATLPIVSRHCNTGKTANPVPSRGFCTRPSTSSQAQPWNAVSFNQTGAYSKFFGTQATKNLVGKKQCGPSAEGSPRSSSVRSFSMATPRLA